MKKKTFPRYDNTEIYALVKNLSSDQITAVKKLHQTLSDKEKPQWNRRVLMARESSVTVENELIESKFDELGKMLHIKKSQMKKKALLAYIETMLECVELRDELEAWQKLGMEANNRFEGDR
ncbi:hypothetical protein COV93_05880 [Candidatus Woesearchaeota archaeon CG11_big_fil_rev_8_21_14_0_20_43_8]|nr:MAG: hypothetical protein COV93_05880 [Candidatus Woesearchaeota archaeon CG11_big_fil_rev_8_21_14_0_20_43_8]